MCGIQRQTALALGGRKNHKTKDHSSKTLEWSDHGAVNAT